MAGFIISNVVNAGLYDVATGQAYASFTKLDSITIDVDAKMQEVYGGSGAYPIVNILADRKPKISLKGPELSLAAAYRLLGANNVAATTGSPIQIPKIEDYTIPAGGTVTLNNTPSTVDTTITVIGVIDDTLFTKVASAPTQGQYSITGNTLTFNTSDVGKTVRVFYSVDSTTGGNIQIAANSIPGIYTFKATGKFLQNINDPQKTAYDIAFVIKSCQLTGNLQFNSERQKASAVSLDLDIIDPGNGFNPIEIRTTAKYA